MKRQLLLSCLASLALAIPASAETVKITPLKGEQITIDGKLSEKIWQRKPDVEKFYLYGPKPENFTPVTTRASLAFDERYIYVGVYCQEPFMNSLRLSGKKYDDPVWKDDSVELFFAPSQVKNCYGQIAINANGVVFDLLQKEPGSTEKDLLWNANPICKTFKGKDFWSLEAAIPLENLPVDAPEGNWKFHITRNRACKGENYSFVEGIDSFHNITRFFTLSGIRIPSLKLTVTEDDAGEGKYGTNQIKVKVRNWSSARVAATLSVKDGKSVTWVEPKSSQVITCFWEHPFTDSKCEQTLVVSEGTKVLRRSKLQKTLPHPFVDERDAVRYIEFNKAITVVQPVIITSLSEKSSQIKWSVRDLNGAEMVSGITGINEGKALLRIFWSFMRPGNYKLDLALIYNGKTVSTFTKDLRLVNSPFEGI